ncbi:MAG TPA: DMT family transporter [Acidimicrobiales bacterium]|nr:DMT family transporter [Acidimicrobiales bacterium]
MAAGGAFSYGVTIICNRRLALLGFGPQATLSIRFGVSALVLFGLLAVLRRGMVPARRERLRLLLLGAVGYAVESALFYSALQRGTAAAVALLFYVYPAIVTVIELAAGRTVFSKQLLGALALSITGTALVVASGGDVSISRTGVLFALGSAVTFAIYLLASGRAVTRSDPIVNGAWVAAGASLSLTVQGLATGGLRNPGADAWLMVANGVATASAFSLLFAALGRLGASRTAVVMTLEAASAVVLAAVLLGESISVVQLVGGAAILAATVLISTSKILSPIEVDEAP